MQVFVFPYQLDISDCAPRIIWSVLMRNEDKSEMGSSENSMFLQSVLQKRPRPTEVLIREAASSSFQRKFVDLEEKVYPDQFIFDLRNEEAKQI